MDTFTKLQKNINNKKPDSSIVYKGDYMEIVNKDGWDFVNEKDMVIILPYIKDEGYFLLHYEPIPPYQFKYINTPHADKTHFITVISGGVEKGENIVETIRRELIEEAGLIISQFYEFHIEGPYFVSKGNCAQYHTCLMELNFNDYKQVMAITDGSKEEKDSKVIKVSLGNIDDIIISDCVTELMITKLKQEYKIK